MLEGKDFVNERPFQTQANKPTELALQSALENTYSSYQKILDLAGSYFQEWTFSKSSGWISLHIRQPADVGRAIALFRQSFDLAAKQRANKALEPEPGDPSL